MHSLLLVMTDVPHSAKLKLHCPHSLYPISSVRDLKIWIELSTYPVKNQQIGKPKKIQNDDDFFLISRNFYSAETVFKRKRFC